MECDPSLANFGGKLYVRSNGTTGSQDIKTYDAGTLTVATVGMQGTNVNVGELWVTYDVELFKPQALNAEGYNLPAAHLAWTSARGGTGPSTAAPFTGLALNPQTLTIPLSLNGDNIGVTLTATSIRLPAGLTGYYRIMMYWTGSSTAVTAPNITYANCASIGHLADGAGSLMSNTGTTCTSLIMEIMILVTSTTGQPVMTFSGGTLPASVVNADLFISQANYPTYAGMLPTPF